MSQLSMSGRGPHSSSGQANNNTNNNGEAKKDLNSSASSTSSTSSNPGGGGKSAKSAAPKAGNNGGRRRNQHQQHQDHAQVHHSGGQGHKNYRQAAKRSTGHNQQAGSRYGEMTPADEFEVGSLFRHGSKKTSMNHLLNFQYEKRGCNDTRRNNPGMMGGQGKGGRRKAPQLYHRPKYNKEHYLQANCQFVVRSGVDYTAHLNDPDKLVDWDMVEQVNMKTSSVPSCPICLHAPTAAKITRCGHVFCWACILHYLALSDNTTRKCPICNDAIHKDDLKSVVSLLHNEIIVGDEIEMHLMRRERNSLFAVPVGKYAPSMEKRQPTLSEDYNGHSQLVIGTPTEVGSMIVARERFYLEQQMIEEGAQPEACFIEEAMRYLSERETGMIMRQEVNGLGNLAQVNEKPSSPESVAAAAAETITLGAVVLPKEEEEEGKEKEACSSPLTPDEKEFQPTHLSTSSDGDGSSVDVDLGTDSAAITAEDLDLYHIQPANKFTSKGEEVKKSTVAAAGRPLPKETFYFYQSSDGQAIFLHALNVQMLVHEYGSFEQCPAVIKGKILEKDSSAMTEELRDKLRYLRHLPVTSRFEVCELDVSDMELSKETFKRFDEQLFERKKKRQRRARLEKRREKSILIENNKLMGVFPEGKKVRIESSFHFPGMNEVRSAIAALETSGHSRSTESLDSIVLGESSDPLVDARGTHIAVDSTGGPSFANMLRGGKKPGQGMPKSDTFPLLMAAAAPPIRARCDSDSEPEPEGYVPPPPQASLGDALAMALQQHSLSGGGAAAAPAGKGGKKKGKKNKGTKILLGSAPRPSM